MPERSNGAVSKTVVLLSRDRGFESLSLRQYNLHGKARGNAGFEFSDQQTVKSLLLKGFDGMKINAGGIAMQVVL